MFAGDASLIRQREAMAQAELVSCRRQLDELREEYNFMASQLANASGGLTPSQLSVFRLHYLNLFFFVQVLLYQIAVMHRNKRYAFCSSRCTSASLTPCLGFLGLQISRARALAEKHATEANEARTEVEEYQFTINHRVCCLADVLPSAERADRCPH
jgi:hypothetical protein